MSEEYGNDFIVLTDEDGEEFELEHMDTIEHEGQTYMAFIPADIDDDNEEPIDLIIMRVVEEDGEELLSTLGDDEEELMNKLYETFMERLEDSYEDDAEESEKE